MVHLPYLLDCGHPGGTRMLPVDDRVMGGHSVSRFRHTDEGTGVFEGVVYLKDGGFASVRCNLESMDLGAAAGVRIRARGDGHRYRLALRNDRKLSGINHMQHFTPPAHEWSEIGLRFEDFRPSFRGYEPPDAPPLDRHRIRQLGLMIADEQEGPFRLEVAWVRGWDGTD